MELGDRTLLSWSLETVAAAEAGADPTRAAQILGAAHALMEDLGDHGDPDILAAVQAAAGEELYERSHAEGRALTLDDAVNLATERLQAP
jgi:hypothetical protein